MTGAKLKSYLEVTVNIATLSVAVLVIYLFAKNYFTAKPASNLLKVGSKLEQLSGYDYSSHQKTLILALSADCKYCTKSAPFYRLLAQKQAENSKADKTVTNVLAIFPDSQDEVAQFLKKHDLTFNTIPKANFDKLKI